MGREYGNSGNYDSAFAGLNARMPEFNALVGLRSLARLEENASSVNVALSPEEIARIEHALPKGAAAGERYAPAMMKSLNG